jgi:rhamnose transport system ATP-binding protein
VHALVGENGAGKSTLIKIITGAERADSGTLRIAGRDVPHIDPASARALGIAAIYQQPSLFPHLTVAENIALALEAGGAWRPIDWKRRRDAAATMLAKVGASIDPERTVDTLSMPEQQIVEIAKAIGGSARVVLMDEPTASLTEREVENLFAVVARLREQQVAVIYISHRLEEISALADRITVLRDGRTVATRPAAEMDRGELIRLMVGRDVSTVFPKQPVQLGPPVLEVRNLSSAAAGIRDVTLTIHRGEILGLAGLVGSRSTAGRFGSRRRRMPSAPALRTCRRTAGSTASCSTCRLPPTRAWRAFPRCRAAGSLTPRASAPPRRNTSIGCASRRHRCSPRSVRCRAATSRRLRWRDGSRPGRQ